MSDFEDEPMDVDNDYSDEESDGCGSMDADGPNELPEGITKEIITEAPPENLNSPKTNDEVEVHYVGTLLTDGSEFDSTKERGTFKFKIGKGQVIKGWDLGVASMKKGEVAKFTLAPEFAYGERGSPPKIPENASLVFNIELVNFVSMDDLFEDEGVIKTRIVKGSGWQKPRNGSEVRMSLKAVATDDSVIEERSGFEYELGTDVLGPIGKAVDKALNGMVKGEEVSLKCSKEYAYGDKTPEGATLAITLEEIFDILDVSLCKNKSVMKKRIQEGTGFESVKDGESVTMDVVAATDGSSPLPNFKPAKLTFTSGNGEVCDALEGAAKEMKKGEKALITVSKTFMIEEEKLGLKDLAAEKVVLTVELVSFEEGKKEWDLSEEEKIAHGLARKEVGTTNLKNGRLHLALERYKKVASLFTTIDNFKDENKEKAKQLKQACEANKAVVYLRLKDYVEAKKCCETVLKDDSRNIKALHRRAQCELNLKNFSQCVTDCKKVIQLDPNNKETRALLMQAREGQKQDDVEAKGLFANMCKALGKGPIPEPGKTENPADMDCGEDDEDEGEDDMEDEEEKCEKDRV